MSFRLHPASYENNLNPRDSRLLKNKYNAESRILNKTENFTSNTREIRETLENKEEKSNNTSIIGKSLLK